MRRSRLLSTAGTVRLSLDEVHTLCLQTLAAAGLHEASRLAVARTITAAERDDCKSHGLFRLPHIFDGIRLGKANPHNSPVVHDIAPGAIRVDAKNGMSPLAFQAGLPLLLDKTRANGIAAMSMVDVFHYSALWPEVEALATEGLVAMAFLTSKSFVAHHGGTRASPRDSNPRAVAEPPPCQSRRLTDGRTFDSRSLRKAVWHQPDGFWLPSRGSSSAPGVGPGVGDDGTWRDLPPRPAGKRLISCDLPLFPSK